jgi:hypothetical protein
LRYFQLLERGDQDIVDGSRFSNFPHICRWHQMAWRSLLAVTVALSVGCAGIVSAANNSVQGAKKEEGGFDGDARPRS